MMLKKHLNEQNELASEYLQRSSCKNEGQKERNHKTETPEVYDAGSSSQAAEQHSHHYHVSEQELC